MSDLADLKTIIASLATDRGPGHALAVAVTIAELLGREVNAELRNLAIVTGRVAARQTSDVDLEAGLSVAASLDEIASQHAAPAVDVEGAPPTSLGARLASALLRTEAGQAALAVRAERGAQARAALDGAEAAMVEARRLARQLDSCRRRAANLERRFEVARETLTRAGAASRVAVGALDVERGAL